MAYRETYEIEVKAELYNAIKSGGKDVGRIIITNADDSTQCMVYEVSLTDENGHEILCDGYEAHALL